MKRGFSTFLFAALLGAAAAFPFLSGCEEGPSCRDVCMHICEICHDTCDLSDPLTSDDVDGCMQGCEEQDPDDGRRDCLMDTQACEDLWRC